jgi:hypothetical protein
MRAASSCGSTDAVAALANERAIAIAYPFPVMPLRYSTVATIYRLSTSSSQEFLEKYKSSDIQYLR